MTVSTVLPAVIVVGVDVVFIVKGVVVMVVIAVVVAFVPLFLTACPLRVA